MVGCNITVELGGLSFGMEDLSLDLPKLGWDGRDLLSAAKWLGQSADGSGPVDLVGWARPMVLLDRPTISNGLERDKEP